MGSQEAYEQKPDRQLDGSFAADQVWEGVQKGTYQDSIRDPNYLYNFGCLRLTPDLQYRTFEKGYEHLYQNVYCDKGLKNLLKCESAYASLISEEGLPYEARRKTLSFYKEDVRRQNSAEVPRRFPLSCVECCTSRRWRPVQFRYKGHQGFAYAPLPQYLELIQDFL